MMRLNRILKNLVILTSRILCGNRKSKILYYHDVFSTVNYQALDEDIFMGTPLENFKKHIAVIRKEGFEIVREITKPENQVTIMFDDGFRGVWECREYFYDENIKPTIFLPIDYIDRTDVGMLSVQEILELQSHGFKFECHGWSHRPFTEVAQNELEHELKDARDVLSDILGETVKEVCMPLGFFNDNVLHAIKKSDFENVYSCLPGNYSDMPYGLLTRNLCQYASAWQVKMILRGGNELLKNRYLKLHHHEE